MFHLCDSFTWDLCWLMMNLHLSMAMVITVREDMKAATQGMVRAILCNESSYYVLQYSLYYIFGNGKRQSTKGIIRNQENYKS